MVNQKKAIQIATFLSHYTEAEIEEGFRRLIANDLEHKVEHKSIKPKCPKCGTLVEIQSKCKHPLLLRVEFCTNDNCDYIEYVRRD